MIASRRLIDLVLVPTLVGGLAAGILQTDWLWPLDTALLDAWLRRAGRPASDDITIVAIDEKSLNAVGRWPWSRAVHARLVNTLADAGVRCVGFDIAFAEPDPEGDALLATAMRGTTVILPLLHEQVEPHRPPVETLPVDPLGRAATALGHVDIQLDPDGVARTVYLRGGLGTATWPFIGLAVLEATGQAVQDLPTERDPEANAAIPYIWSRDHRVLLSFAGPPGHFRRVSYTDVLEGRVPSETLRNDIVLVGPTAAGLGDSIATPFSGAFRPMPGVEFVANVVNALQTRNVGRYLAPGFTLAITFCIAFAATATMMLVRRRWITAAMFGGVTLVGAIGMLAGLFVWFTPTPTLAGIALGLGAATWRRRSSVVRTLSRERRVRDATLHSMEEAVIGVDQRGMVEFVSSSAEEWLERNSDGMRGRPLGEVLHLRDGETDQPLAALTARETASRRDAMIVLDGGARKRVRVSTAPVRDSSGRPDGLVVVLAEPATAPPALELVSSWQPDPLTRLPGRRQIEARLAETIEEARATGSGVAVLFVDLERFRVINRGLGAQAGDQLLRAVADRLREVTDVSRDVARVAADEFVLILEGVSTGRDARRGAERVVEILSPAFQIGGTDVSVDVSVGISVYPRDGDGPDALLRRADTAVRWAREFGHDRIQEFAGSMEQPDVDRLLLERHLRTALERNELSVSYQPQISLATGRLVGVEALLRWRNPELGLVAPATFVPVAEETGLIVSVGEWVLRTACRQGRQWADEGLPALRVSVNVSPRQFRDARLVESVLNSLEDTGLPTTQLALEVTESALVKDMDGAAAVMRRLKHEGIEIALDDFGVGYSSLSYLKQFPFDRVKIDKAFVRHIADDEDDRTLCAGVMAIAHSRHRRVTAEGVESEDQLEFLRAKGCDEVQGYLFGRPVPAPELLELIRIDAIRLA